MQDRWGVMIRGERVAHSTASRDWYCICGHKVVTRHSPWRSVCSEDEDHDPNQFIHTNAIPYVQFKMMVEKLEADEVFKHLPKELQEAIRKEEQNVTD